MLLSDRFAPISSACGVVKAPQKSVVECFINWQRSILQPLGCDLNSEQISGSLEDTLHSLLPLTSPVRTRYLFISTTTDWTVFLDNGWRGTDASAVAVLADRCQCEAVRVVAQKHTLPARIRCDSPGTYGAAIMEVFDQSGASRRSIFAANDGGRWKFGQAGKPFPFEDLNAYSRGAPKDRFTLEMLTRYLIDLGIYAFDRHWYVTSAERPAVLVSRVGGLPSTYQEHGLSLNALESHR